MSELTIHNLKALMEMNLASLTQPAYSDVLHTGLAPDWRIRELVEQTEIISPFVEKQQRQGVISFGLSSMGYDMRIADEFQVFAVPLDKQGVVDPKSFDTNLLRHHKVSAASPDNYIQIPPNSFALGRSIEYFKLPRNVLGICLGKSTYARCGIICNFTPLEPGWEGYLTIEISNTTPLPAKIYANEGIAQVLFFEALNPDVSYADKKGKYQGQIGITNARI